MCKYIDLVHPDNMNLNESYARQILREKAKGNLTNAQIAGTNGRDSQKAGSEIPYPRQVLEADAQGV